MEKSYPEHVNIENITYGYLTSYSQFGKLILSKDLPQIYSKDENFLIIYAIYPKLTRVTSYPIQSQEIWKLKIQLNLADHAIITKINTLIHPNKTVHTTGLSEKNGKYVVENYLFPMQSWAEGINIIDMLKNFETVDLCQMERIPFTSFFQP